MHLNELKPQPRSRKTAKRVGRGAGSGLGKTCGRGHKGQKSRRGGALKAGFEGGQMPLQRRLPKSGFNSMLSSVTAEVRLSELARVDADVIDLEALSAAGVIPKNIKRVKIIATGELGRAVSVQGLGLTRGARAAIEASGGKVVEK